jgi:hypothetical protein
VNSLPSHRAAIVAVGVAAATLIIVAFWPTRTRVGVNYEVAEHRLPLWRKGWSFLERDARTRRLAEQVAGGIPGAEERAIAVLRWTNQHVRRHPPGVDVVDDHVWSIVQRGYGSSDQQADVFATLLTYAGVPAYWILIGPERPSLPISLVLIGGEWRVFDVERGVVFRDSTGGLLAAGALERSPEMIRRSAEERVGDPDAYLRWFNGFRAPEPPDILRAEMQMPARRLGYELRKLLRLRT